MQPVILSPSLQLWLNLSVTIGAETVVGHTTDGRRVLYPITGGSVQGVGGISGRVLPGGFDNYCQGSNGIGSMDARYALQLDDGAVLLVHNRGFLHFSTEGAALEAAGVWPIPAELYHCRCQPEIRTGAGRYQWVNHQLFVGTVHYPLAERVEIAIYRLA
ncbi:DUF3237 domain-containing protein [Aquitalea magnusonii]|uniref:DUF3237 domain-containing protein n=1 Tax=Aquitalea magnusonii TaxID=332411 RepID=UPI000B5C9646|nr:DUF3237 domain-containing protein [Aquitalea magnusonii]